MSPGGPCGGGPPGLGASSPSTLNPQPSTPLGPPFSPPGHCNSSVPDPLYVLDWNDGLVLFAGVKEYEFPSRPVDLRAQVYGATVSSYSWDLTQAPDATNVSGSSTYRLQFTWNSSPQWEVGQLYKTETITVTATMTDSSQQSMTLTFRLLNASGGVGAATWPAVLTPDKPLEQGLGVGGWGLESDSATRPYAVSLESGVLYATHSLPAYNPGVPALGMTFSSIAAERRPIFINRYELDPNASVPNTVSARLQFNGSWGSSKYYDTSPSTTKFNPGDILQISLQADAGSLSTGRYDYTFETTANYSGSSTTTTSSGSVTIINEESSVFGEGWSLGARGWGLGVSEAGNLFNRLHVVTGGVILNQGAGNSLWFAESGGNYTTPAGDFSTLVKNGDNTYTRTLKDGTKQNFNTSGYQTALVDLNSNRVTFTYDGSNNLSAMTDPNSLVTTFSYSGSCGASGKVCTITDPAGRVTSLAYNASGTLKTITDPDGAVSTFTYDSSSGRMATLVDPRSNTTSFTSNFAGRVTTVTRPDSTTEIFAALQLQSLCDSGQCTQGQPGTPLLAAEAVSDYTDPRSNAWDYRLDWLGLGSSTQITDPLGQTTPAGHITVRHRDSNGLASMVTDRLDRHSFFERDSKGNITKLTHPDLKTRLYEFNSNGQMTKATDELNRVTTFTYDSEGNLTQITQPDPDGGGSQTSPITTFTYTADGFVETEVNARGKTTTFSYDSRDRVTQVTYPDDDGDANNNPKVTFTYDSASNVESRKDERGNTTSFTYDGMNRVKTVTTPDRDGAGGLPAPVTTYTYDAAGNRTVTTRPDPDGSGSLASPVATLTYNSMNRVATGVDALSNTSTFTYDNAGNLTAVTDPLSRTTSFTYNELNQQVTHKTPLGNVTTFTFDAEGQLLTSKDPLNRITTYTYNNRGWVATATDPTNSTWAYSYDAVGNRTASDDPLASENNLGYTYDALDRVIAVTDPLLHTVTYTYDAVGNRTAVTDPLSHTTTQTFDARNRLTVVTQPDPDGGGSQTSPVTTYTYDAAGNRTVVTDPLSGSTTFAYDAGNRRTSITQPDPDGGGSLSSPITTFTYDNLDRVISLKDPVNNLTTWTYDAVDQVLTELDPLGKTATYTHDAAGQLTKLVDRKSQRREFVYDNDGRRTQEKWCTTASGTCTTSRIFTYTYDAANQLTEVNEPDSRYTFTYDNAGRVTGISSLASNMPQVTLSNIYDDAGNRTQVTDNLSSAGTIDFEYDAAYRMTSAAMIVGSDFGPNVAFGYDVADRLTSLQRSIPVCDTCPADDRRILSTFTFDNAYRMTAITHTYSNGGPETTLATYTYSYNAASELTNETNADGTYTYTYDNTGQLTGVDASGGTCGATGCDESFSYDVNGNRTMTGYTSGTGNRLTSDGTYNYTYDDNGNTLTKTRITDNQKTEFSWDHRNRLTQVLLKNSGGTILQQSDYTYDAFNRRIIKSFDDDGPGPHTATVTKTIYDAAQPPTADQISNGTTPLQPDGSFASHIFTANPYGDFDGSNTLTMRYLYGRGVDEILARRDASGTIAWYLADHLGTIRDLVNTSGTVLDHINYSAYGKVTAETQPSNGDRFKFTGREYELATAFFYYRARFYNATTGRFLKEDPIAFRADDPNLYRYVANQPQLKTDPTGTQHRPVRDLPAPWGPYIPGLPDPNRPESCVPGAGAVCAWWEYDHMVFDYLYYQREVTRWEAEAVVEYMPLPGGKKTGILIKIILNNGKKLWNMMERFFEYGDPSQMF